MNSGFGHFLISALKALGITDRVIAVSGQVRRELVAYGVAAAAKTHVVPSEQRNAFMSLWFDLAERLNALLEVCP